MMPDTVWSIYLESVECMLRYTHYIPVIPHTCENFPPLTLCLLLGSVPSLPRGESKVDIVILYMGLVEN